MASSTTAGAATAIWAGAESSKRSDLGKISGVDDLLQIEIFDRAVQCWYNMNKHRAKGAVAVAGDEECQALDAAAAKVMSARLSEAGEEVFAEEIKGAVLALRRAVLSQGEDVGTGYAQFGVVGDGRKSRKFRLWREMGGAGVIDTETASRMRISLKSHLLEGTRLIQTQIPGTLDRGWDPHDTPCGGAAMTTVRMSDLLGASREGFVWKESHYSFGSRWDPSADTAAANYYFASGTLKCRQRFLQGVSRALGDIPVFEGFYPDGTPRAIEYGDAQQGRHRPINLGPAYQEFHPNGSPSLIIFAEKGIQRGRALRFNPNGDKVEGGKETIACDSITNAEAWALRDETSENSGGFGEALIEAVRFLSAAEKGEKGSRARSGRGR